MTLKTNRRYRKKFDSNPKVKNNAKTMSHRL